MPMIESLEESLKNRIARDYFADFIYEPLGKIDFSLKNNENETLFWAEAKKEEANILESFTQLVLTIGVDQKNSAKPPFLGVFDFKKIAFIETHFLSDFYDSNKFNEISWNKVTPSNYKSPEFLKMKNRIQAIILKNAQIFYFEEDEMELKAFISNSLSHGELQPIEIDADNFVLVYSNWYRHILEEGVIDVDFKDQHSGFKKLREDMKVLESDFFLADLISENDKTLNENFRVLLEKKENGEKVYHFKHQNDLFKDRLWDLTVDIIDADAHTLFWKKYKRPPAEKFWKEIYERRDKLAPRDIRERKGAFFTPAVWVKKAQEYLKEALGDNWENEYYVWDCAAGTGNLLVGLKNPARLFASTIDLNDVIMMKNLVQMEEDDEKEKLDLLEDHIFQFDFLNDDFSKLPENLQRIIQNESDKLVIFINPPYAEAPTGTTPAGTGKNKPGVARNNKICVQYKEVLGKANNELFAQFFMRIYKEIPDCVLASFSKLKYINSANFIHFRETFLAKFLKGFVCPANTFDNVNGEFPIGFLVWNTKEKKPIKKIKTDVFNKENKKIGKKNFYAYSDQDFSLQKWWFNFKDESECLALMSSYPADFQHNSKFSILSKPQARYCLNITRNNLIPYFIYFAVRQTIASTWLNDRDQFLYPNKKWKGDKTFQNNCFVFTLFHGQNGISNREKITNHFIPFDEKTLAVKSAFESHFLLDFMAGRIKVEKDKKNFLGENEECFIPQEPLEFSNEAQNVLNTAKELFIYYHQVASNKKTAHKINKQSPYLLNATLYDIKEFFQGRSKNGRMKSKSEDEKYTELLNNLKNAQKELALQIEPKIFEYGFLNPL